MRPSESFVGQPARSIQTMLRVIAEDNDSIPTLVPDGIYGQATLNSVTAFQRSVGIPITGIVDQRTWDSIYEAFEEALIRIDKAEPIEIIMNPGKVFQRGEYNPYLYLAQSMLLYLSKTHDLMQPSHTGVLDDPTSQALAGFQILAGLPPTGELDKKTWKYLVKQFTLNANANEQIFDSNP